MACNDTFIYGLFDRGGSVREAITGVQGKDEVCGNIFCGGWSYATKGSLQLYICCRIYNADAIRTHLKTRSQDLADLVLELYMNEGVKGFRRLDGKFTILLLEADKTIIVRDRNGEGRMIYFTKDFFTDDYCRISNFKVFSPKPDYTGLMTFLKIGYIPAPVTSLKGLQKVPAGEILRIINGKISFEKLFGWDDIIEAERKEIPDAEAASRYGELLIDSLQRRIGNSKEVGILLSGGYDSGGNLAMVSKFFTGKIRTYSIGFKQSHASELPFARMTAAKYGSEHRECLMDGNEIEYLPGIIDCMGDPFSESGFMLNHTLMKIVGEENLPVVIGGDGNDQYFGTGIRETALHYQIRKYSLSPVSKIIDNVSDNSLFDRSNLAFRIQYQNQKFLKIMEPESFGFRKYQLRHLLPVRSIPEQVYCKEHPTHYASFDELFLQRNYFLHIRHSVNEVIIHKASRLSDYFGVNLAFSYTDLDIYNFLRQLPVRLRAMGSVDEMVKGKGVSKYIFRKLIADKLPEPVAKRHKQGGFTPLEIFFRCPVRRNSIYSYIRSSAYSKSLKDPTWLQSFFHQYEVNATCKGHWFWYNQVRSNQLLNLLIISIWWDKIFEKKQGTNLSDFL